MADRRPVSNDGRQPKLRCAIYTRKSSEEGLEQDFNSLDAQREACEAFVVSQKREGWILLPETVRRRRLSRAAPWSGRHSNGCCRMWAPARSTSWSSTRSTG